VIDHVSGGTDLNDITVAAIYADTRPSNDRYLRDLPPASSEYSPQSARRGDEADHVRLRPTAWLENRELLLCHYWTSYSLA
jgi:hypothetical protein